MKIMIRFTILITMFAGISACASVPVAPTPTSPPTTPTPLATPSISLDAIAGTYTSTLAEEALEQVGTPISTLPFLEGTFKMEFTTEGIVRMWKENAVGFSDWLEGTYTLSADTLTFGLDRGREACSRGGFGIGSYNWSLENGQLTLTLIADECGRKHVMTASPWTKLP
jgi:hypothetical protein